MRRDWFKLLALTLPVMTGCLSHTRSLQQPKLAGVVRNAEANQLVEALNQRYEQVNSLSATVTFTASVGGAHKGQQTDYTSIQGYIRLRKPQMLRVLGYLPVVRLRAFDLASDGKSFTLLVPPKRTVIKGSTDVGTRAANPLENLRPAVFSDSILIRSISADSIVSMTNSSQTTMQPKPKQLIETPQYDLTVSKPDTTSAPAGLPQLSTPLRVIHFSRITLLPTGQDIYNAEGDLETQVTYGPYQDFHGTQFPGTITINRLLDEYRITLTVQKLTENQPLTDDQFLLEVPEGYKVQKMP